MILLLFLLLPAEMTACSSRGNVSGPGPHPVPRSQARPAKPFDDAVWIAGNWEWRGNEYVWKPGQWIDPEIGKPANSSNWKKSAGTKKWVAGYWKKTPQGMVWVKGHWN